MITTMTARITAIMPISHPSLLPSLSGGNSGWGSVLDVLVVLVVSVIALCLRWGQRPDSTRCETRLEKLRQTPASRIENPTKVERIPSVERSEEHTAELQSLR